MWNLLTNEDEIQKLIKGSFEKPQLIFKHSTRCSISISAKFRMERSFSMLNEVFSMYYVDVLQNRPVSNLIAKKFQVIHQSPQVLVILKGEVWHSWSHSEIQPYDILEEYQFEKNGE